MNAHGPGTLPRATAAAGFTLPELEAHWREAHRRIAQERDSAQSIVEVHPWLVTCFDDFAHRLGMRANLRILGSLDGRRVLDLGCGRGRWAEAFARRGAVVTGIDWSSEALGQARSRVTRAAFVCMPVTGLAFPPNTFDVVNSVTVVQHLLHELQERALCEAACVLVPGGWLSLIELTAAQPGPHVFPRPAQDWVELARACGFIPVSVRGCSYELVLRPYKAFRKVLRGSPSHGAVGASSGPVSWRQRANRLAMAGLALPAFPVELISLALPANTATHAAMPFRRREDGVQQ